MDSNSTLITGIAPEHVPALVAALLVLPLVWVGLRVLRRLDESWATAFLKGWDGAGDARRLTAILLLTTGVIHLALPLGHHDTPLLTLMFWASGIAFVVIAFRSLGDGKWRGKATVLLIGSIAAYLVVAGSGWQEEPDQLGIATKLIELTAVGLIVVPQRAGARGIRRLIPPKGSVSFVFLTLGTGAVVWIGSFVAHSTSDAAVEPHDHEPGTGLHTHDAGGHSHDFAARAQAGVIMRPVADEPPTLEQVEAAARLAEDTRLATTPYVDYQAALADGYTPDGPELGLQRHLKNKKYEKDGRILDPKKPELLVYASTDDENYLLLGVAYTMEEAGEPGPAIGGSLTRWHSHNICFTLLPPGFGLVSPFGSCPLGAVSVTLPEMMHVWTVENPDGPYADKLDDKWVKKLIAASAAE